MNVFALTSAWSGTSGDSEAGSDDYLCSCPPHDTSWHIYRGLFLLFFCNFECVLGEAQGRDVGKD